MNVTTPQRRASARSGQKWIINRHARPQKNFYGILRRVCRDLLHNIYNPIAAYSSKFCIWISFFFILIPFLKNFVTISILTWLMLRKNIILSLITLFFHLERYIHHLSEFISLSYRRSIGELWILKRFQEIENNNAVLRIVRSTRFLKWGRFF